MIAAHNAEPSQAVYADEHAHFAVDAESASAAGCKALAEAGE